MQQTIQAKALTGVIAAAAAAFLAYLDQLLIPVAVLVLVMISDYITGLMAAWITDTLSSRVGIIGILKKVAYLFVVMVGAVIDYMVSLVGESLDLEISVRFAALLICCWLITNELISILENIKRMGGPVPPWVGNVLNHLKRETELSAPQVPAEESQGQKGRHERS